MKLTIATKAICLWCRRDIDQSGGLKVTADEFACDKCIAQCTDTEIVQDRALAAAMMTGQNTEHRERVERLLEADPGNPFWAFAFTMRETVLDPNVERLTVKWLKLNLHNPHLSFVNNFSDSSSRAILGAVFKWMKNGGLYSRSMPRMLDHFVRGVTQNHKALRPHVIEFVRKWLKDNENHEYAGPAYSALISATRLKYDIVKARRWYSAHKHYEHAWHVIAALLEIAYWDAVSPSEFEIQEARALLQNGKFREKNPRLVADLVSVCPDEQSVLWAKLIYGRTGYLWILVRLLWRAPDLSLFEVAENEHDRWIGTGYEPEILYAMLTADPQNHFARNRAQVWLEHNPTTHNFYTAIRSAMKHR